MSATLESQLPSYFVPDRFASAEERDKSSFTERLLKDSEIEALEKEASMSFFNKQFPTLHYLIAYSSDSGGLALAENH